ncbi:MAG: polynucleotide adenylyltransferase [Ectothiorhodospiraceae bacterium]|nr:polynucleotide adenylyltransferase [Ectothiorhodospiraceae bacterium]
MASSPHIPEFILEIAEEIRSRDGILYIVGGWVRDYLLGHDSHDYDLEVYGIEADALESLLRKYGKPSRVGRSFGIIILARDGVQYDFALPRTESKTGKGHKGFLVNPDPTLTFETASSRRDFTMNAMGMKLPEFELVDYHGGKSDLENRVLRHVSDAFSEDPLRALRAVQFAARFGLEIDPATQKLCSRQPLDELSPERIFGEFTKLLMKSRRPSIGLEWMRNMDLLRFFPELGALVGVKQDPEWHPEGDVWTHTLMVVDEAAVLRSELADEKEQMSFMFGALCHDFGKPATTQFVEGRWKSPKHDVEGRKLVERFMSRMTNESALIEDVVKYCEFHLRPIQFYNARDEVSDGAIRRLALKIDIRKLVLLAKADQLGRTTPEALERVFPAGDWLLKRSEELQVLDSRPEPLLGGKDLISLGMRPGPAMGEVLREAFDLQLEGKLSSREDALAWAKERESNALHE